MTAYVVRDIISNEIAMACEECGTTGEWLENRPGNRVVVNNMVTTHNSAQHWENPLKPFQAGILTTSDFNGHTPHMVTGQDFTESHQGEGDNKPDASLIVRQHPGNQISGECGGECTWYTVTQKNDEDGWSHINAWYSVHLTKHHGATIEQAFQVDHGTYNFHANQDADTSALKTLSDTLRIKTMRIKQLESEAVERETLNKEMRQTIQELLETPDPMPLCKNLEGHNYIPLDTMFVFCTHCGHSIHYKTK